MSTTDIAKVGIELAGKAPPGPWKTLGKDIRKYYLHHDHRMAHAATDDIAAFIAHACNNFEALAKRVIELEDEHKLLVAVAEAAGVFEHFLSKSKRAPGRLQRTLTAWRER